ncbi:hypothetical protein pETSU_033 [Edwardsiella phage pEt-SU]|uniref:Uncharacterized protein n=1 Tax=Edwardsiella phage pEt-SU TaxID=2562142 RepID=A0A4D6DWD2_9CAUD|nr:hypothetical protein HOV39_gp033 [Edwardsiella phage pEt-SU]QBZ70614.1 hypothetical protein pETSU_033 [Edwardsiella phage pEt-SU]
MSEEKQVPVSEMAQGIAQEAVISTLRSAIIGDVDEGELALPLFLGTDQGPHQIIYQTARAYMGFDEAVKRGAEREAEVLKTQFEQLREEHFPGVDDTELSIMLQNYFNFFFRTFDRAMVRSSTIDLCGPKNWTNSTPGRGETRMGFINAMKPSVDAKMSMRDRMRRNFLQAYDQPDSFNMMLLNSMIFLKVNIPTPMDLIRLINDIQTKLRQYGERFQVSSLHLERAGISELIVDFVLDHTKYWSVKDIEDPRDLKPYIRSSDINHIAQMLLSISSPRGVNFRIYCLANQCKYSAVKVIDPANMVLTVEEDMPEEHRKIKTELMTTQRKLSREELDAIVPVYRDKEGKPIDLDIPLSNGTGKLVLGVPFLDEYFGAFVRMAERINPRLRQLAVDFPNPKIYADKRKEFMSTLRMGEYLQWIRQYVVFPAPGTEGEDDVMDRDEDPEGFEEGLIDIFNKDEDLFGRTLEKVLSITPRLTYTFIGVMEDECPSCKKKAEGVRSNELAGFTPIDPVMNFFDHRRMMIGLQASRASFVEDSLS